MKLAQKRITNVNGNLWVSPPSSVSSNNEDKDFLYTESPTELPTFDDMGHCETGEDNNKRRLTGL